MTDLGGCTIAEDASGFDCGDLPANESRSYSFRGIASTAGTFHFELALRALVHPFGYVNNHADGADASVWDETVSEECACALRATTRAPKMTVSTHGRTTRARRVQT